MCVFCLTRGVECIAEQAVQAELAAIPTADRADLTAAAVKFAKHNALLLPAQSKPRRLDNPEAKHAARVKAQSENYWDHIRWCNRIAGAEPKGALLVMLITSMQMHRRFMHYLSQPGAPQSWTELERQAPGATIVWLTWFEVWCRGYLAIGSPFVYEARVIVEQMGNALQQIPPLLIGARTDLRNDAERIIVSGAVRTQLSIGRNRRMMHALADRPDDVSLDEELYAQLPASVLLAWHGGDWYMLRGLRNRTAGYIERDGAEPKKRGRPRKGGQQAFQATQESAERLRPDGAIEALEAQETLKRLVARAELTPNEAKVVACFLDEGGKPRDIAAHLGMSPGSVRVHKCNAFKKIRRTS